MAVTLAEAKNNALEDYDPFVIDEFRKSSVILDSLIFDDAVNPAGGGATLDYSYRRQETQPTAEFRAINTEYSPSTTTTKKYSTTLAVLGGAFEIDRILANIGPKGSDEVTRNINEKVKAAITLFQDTVINGDVGVNDKAFDGLDKALTGSSTEMKPTSGTYDWTDLEGEKGNTAIDTLDEFLDLLDGTPTIVVGNKKALARVRAMVRRTSMYVREPIDGLANANGRPISRESYGGILFADAGEKAGSNDPIIPIATDGTTSLYAYRVGLDGFCGITTTDGTLVKTWLPDFTQPGAVHRGEVELGPVGVALKATKAAGVLRKIKVR
ncbi:phage capsid protein [Bifidobacterium pseudocatenulatum]|uniref:major capsid protein n=1 Tax=Bifidobacterium pseudocatenulatum TaxID=28026 RepID=UPI001CFC4BC4|nr:phage capsid protein [Bifidobacterium pseudocatenulatum]MCB4871612.1 phage capsid protein [Bifidobacterium pseudocatenulatum]UDG91425.1 phage capsid protein [Bifidobacterium pseudocatenulatum]UDG92641.1 phage capsid protein [Bifidobacterium pseudocatenulatum]